MASIDPDKLTVPNLLKSLRNADKVLDNLASDLDGIVLKLQNSKLTERQEQQVINTGDRIDANIARISSMRAALYETLYGRFRLDMNLLPDISQTTSARTRSRSRSKKNITRRVKSV